VDTTTQALTVLLLLLAMALSVIVTQFIRRRRDLYVLRPIAAYDALPGMVGAAVEASRPIHVSLGSAGLGGSDTLLSLASAELFYQTASRAAIGAPPIFTASEGTAVPLGQDTLRRAYASRNLLDRYRRSSIRWYPSGTRSLAFAGALTAMLGDDRVSGSVLVGSFGPEAALILGAAARRRQTTIAASDQLSGQAVAYVMADQPLIGEEVFTAGAYLGGTPSQVAAVVTLDVLRWLLIVVIFIPTAIAIGDAVLQGRFSAALARLLGGG
jgi:hypothetical protein